MESIPHETRNHIDNSLDYRMLDSNILTRKLCDAQEEATILAFRGTIYGQPPEHTIREMYRELGIQSRSDECHKLGLVERDWPVR